MRHLRSALNGFGPCLGLAVLAALGTACSSDGRVPTSSANGANVSPANTDHTPQRRQRQVGDEEASQSSGFPYDEFEDLRRRFVYPVGCTATSEYKMQAGRSGVSLEQIAPGKQEKLRAVDAHPMTLTGVANLMQHEDFVDEVLGEPTRHQLREIRLDGTSASGADDPRQVRLRMELSVVLHLAHFWHDRAGRPQSFERARQDLAHEFAAEELSPEQYRLRETRLSRAEVEVARDGTVLDQLLVLRALMQPDDRAARFFRFARSATAIEHLSMADSGISGKARFASELDLRDAIDAAGKEQFGEFSIARVGPHGPAIEVDFVSP